MTSAMIGWFVAGIFITAFLILWFCMSYRVLSEKRRSLEATQTQVAFHRRMLMKERGGKYDGAAQNVLESRQLVSRTVAKEYDALLGNPLFLVPGYIMGFRPTPKDDDR